jgi:hypothetical protein
MPKYTDQLSTVLSDSHQQVHNLHRAAVCYTKVGTNACPLDHHQGTLTDVEFVRLRPKRHYVPPLDRRERHKTLLQ